MFAANEGILKSSAFFTPLFQTPLTPDLISADGLVLSPSFGKLTEPPPYHNDIWRHGDIAKPKKPTIIGQTDAQKLGNSRWIYNCGSFIVKPHNCDCLFLPAEFDDFEDFAQQSLNYEFACNARDAFKREAILLVESSTAIPGQAHRNIAKDLHAHPPSSNPKTATFNVRYYSTVSRDETGFYTGQLDLQDVSPVGTLIRRSEKYSPDFRARSGDIVAFTSVHAHQGGVETTLQQAPRVIAIMGWMDEYANVEPRNVNPMIKRWQRNNYDYSLVQSRSCNNIRRLTS